MIGCNHIPDTTGLAVWPRARARIRGRGSILQGTNGRRDNSQNFGHEPSCRRRLPVFLLGLQIGPVTASLLWATVIFAALTLPSSIVEAREGWEAFLFRACRAHTFESQSTVPTHAEPPAVVISTLDGLAALDYPDFEVLVIDNNTADPALWEPVREHCLRLGSRFRFLHVEGISGAKTGELNWVAPHTDPHAELIGVVDADYHVSPDWLKKTVGYFAEPRVGFVQAPPRLPESRRQPPPAPG